MRRVIGRRERALFSTVILQQSSSCFAFFGLHRLARNVLISRGHRCVVTFKRASVIFWPYDEACPRAGRGPIREKGPEPTVGRHWISAKACTRVPEAGSIRA